jgi:TrmH family RNA methyltransferase
MLSKAGIKHIRSLHLAKFRIQHGEFIAEGVKVVDELLHSDYPLLALCATRDWMQENQTLISPLKAEIHEVNEEELARISALSTPNKVLAVFRCKENDTSYAPATDELALVLEDLRDPGNLGTIIRIADWFGIRHIFCSEQSVDVYNPKTVQSTMGSLARVNISYHNLIALTNDLRKTHTLYATVLKGSDITETKLSNAGIIMIGSESHGLSRELMDAAHHQITIPAWPHPLNPTAESLNASIATAICCYEFRRRK